MKADYKDITSRIDEKPSWYDQNGVPRYGKFHPDNCPDIYANMVVLMRIECQSCGMPFDVELHKDDYFGTHLGIPRTWHYGDPPRHGHSGGVRCAGETMNCIDIEVLKVYKRNHNKKSGWARVKELEQKCN